MTRRALVSRLRRSLWIAAVGLGLFTVAGFFVLPPIAKSQFERRVSAALGRTVTVGRVRLNPYTVALTLEDFDIRLKAGHGSLLTWKRLYVNFDPLASLAGDWVLSEVELADFQLGVILRPDGSLNFSDLIEKATALAAKPEAGPVQSSRAVRIGNLKVERARVEFLDESRKRPFATVLGPVSFRATGFRTAGARGAPSHFEAVTEAGEKLAWTGTLSAEPLRSDGEFRLENIVLAKYAPYYSDLTRADVMAGRLTLRGRYELSLTEGQRAIRLSEAVAELRDLRLNERANGEPVAEIPALDLRGIQADALTQVATIESCRIAGGWLAVRRDPDGTLNLQQMLQSDLGPTAPAKPPQIAIGEISVENFRLAVADRAVPRPVRLNLDGLQFALRNFSLNDGAVMPLQLALNWAPQGTVKVAGNLSLRPELKADLRTDVAELAILPLSPYLEQLINARIAQGTVTTGAAVQVATTGGAPALSFAGDVRVEQFGLVDGVHNEPLAGFDALALTGLKVATGPQFTLAIAELQLTAPFARVVVNADRSINLLAVAKVGQVPGSAAEEKRPDGQHAAGEPQHAHVAKAREGEQATPAASPSIEIEKIAIAAGEFSLADRSVEPNVRMALNQFSGTVTGLSSAHLARGEVDLKGTVDGAGPIRITGKLDPFGRPRFADLKLDFKNVDLLPLSPYSGRYAGFELARGKLALDIKARLEDRALAVSNVITLNPFNFGTRVDSPDATSLPVRLGVALLKDMDGQIVLDVPVEGSLDDPSFRVGKVVLRVIVNLLTKAAVSPFALLGSMFGGGGDELAFQEFSPGGSTLLPTETKKLDTMVKALANRPGLSVALEGRYDGPADTFALRQQKLTDRVRRAIWEAKRAVDPRVSPPDQLVPTPEEEAGMVKKLFDEKFPPGTRFGAPLAAAPVVAAPPPMPKKGIFARLAEAFAFKAPEGKAPPAAEKAAAVAGGAEATGPTLVEMTGRLAETMEVSDDDLRTLALERARQVRDYFITTGKIDPERLFLTKEPATLAEASKGPRVFLTLQ